MFLFWGQLVFGIDDRRFSSFYVRAKNLTLIAEREPNLKGNRMDFKIVAAIQGELSKVDVRPSFPANRRKSMEIISETNQQTAELRRGAASFIAPEIKRKEVFIPCKTPSEEENNHDARARLNQLQELIQQEDESKQFHLPWQKVWQKEQIDKQLQATIDSGHVQVNQLEITFDKTQCRIELDGEPLTKVRSLKLEIEAGQGPRLTIEYLLDS